VRVNDAGSGQPTPVRIRFAADDGTYLAPFGRLADFATGWGEDVGGSVLLGDKRFAYIDGTCEIALPADPVTVEIGKGFEYTPLRERVELGPAKIALRFALERWADMRQEGWYCGDTRAHFLSPPAALLEGSAEDLAVVNLLAMECDLLLRGRSHHFFSNILAFSGQKPALESAGHLVVVNTLNTHPVLGRLGPAQLPPCRLSAELRRPGRLGQLDAGRLVRSVPPQGRAGRLDRFRPAILHLRGVARRATGRFDSGQGR
jgi:hypothetical protein